MHRDHTLFIAYAPADNPQVAVAVVVEHGGHGGSVAAPIARAMFTSYFGLEPPESPEPSAEGSEVPAERPEVPAERPEVPAERPEVPAKRPEVPVAPADSGD
jgi:penicillin-binding protein 2